MRYNTCMNIATWKFLPHSLKRRLLQAIRYQIQPFVYVALGDSTAEGMGASTPQRSYTNIVFESLKDRYKQAKYLNVARSGAILKDVLQSQMPKAIEAKPSLITLSIGANDIIRRTKLDEFEGDLRELLTSLRQKTDATILISTVPDLSLTPAVPKLLKTYSKYKAGKLNQIIYKVGEETSTVTVDLFEDSRAVLKMFPEAIASDGWHPSDFGYALWANTILVMLRNVLAPVSEKELPHEENMS